MKNICVHLRSSLARRSFRAKAAAAKVLFSSFVFFVPFMVTPRSAFAEVWSDTVFVGDVSTQAWQSVSGISSVVTNGGYYTNSAAVLTNYYRASATNLAGRIPLSTNISVVFRPHATLSNAVYLAWTRHGGINRHVIEKSYDAGTTWTNWLTLAPDVVSWLDTGSNTWTTNIFTNAVAAIPGQTVPWAAGADVDTLQTNIMEITNAAFQVMDSAGVRIGYYTNFDTAAAAAPAHSIIDCLKLGEYEWTYSVVPSNGVSVVGHGGLTLSQTNRNHYIIFNSRTATFEGIAFLSAYTNAIPTASMGANDSILKFAHCRFTNSLLSTKADLGCVGTSVIDLRDTVLETASGNIPANSTTTVNDYGGSVWTSTTVGTTNLYSLVDAARVLRISGALSWNLFPGKSGSLVVVDTAGVTNTLAFTNGVVGGWQTNSVEVP